MTHEITLARRWIYQILTADAQFASKRIYPDRAPNGVIYPFVVYEVIAHDDDTMGIGSKRVWSSFYVSIKAVDQSANSSNIEALADRIDVLLHGKADQAVTGGKIIACVRMFPIGYSEDKNSKSYSHLGGVYYLIAQSS